MRSAAILIATALASLPIMASAQSGVTQSRDGLGTGSHPQSPTNASPAGTENATSGPQSRPAYPSGSDTPNPGAAFVRNRPVPATGTAVSPPGALSTTTTTQGGQTTTRPGGSPVTTEGAAPLPPKP
ncbi:MAG TPA: hypothetical protein VGC15_10180 [Acetobacteraceae bacterium]